jgi:hypothetical protein
VVVYGHCCGNSARPPWTSMVGDETIRVPVFPHPRGQHQTCADQGSMRIPELDVSCHSYFGAGYGE